MGGPSDVEGGIIGDSLTGLVLWDLWEPNWRLEWFTGDILDEIVVPLSIAYESAMTVIPNDKCGLTVYGRHYFGYWQTSLCQAIRSSICREVARFRSPTVLDEP